jgi:hypothetical protein
MILMMTSRFRKQSRDLREVENIIDEYMFYTFQSSYLDLVNQLKSVTKRGETPHSLLIDFLFWSLEKQRERSVNDL